MTTETTENVLLPDHVDHEGQGQMAWRATDGKLRRGQAENEEVRGPLLGFLKEITIWEGETKDDNYPYSRLFVRLTTGSEGDQTIAAYIQKPKDIAPAMNTRLMGLATGILAVNLGEPCQIEAKAGTKLNDFKKYTTYTNVYRYNPATGKLWPKEAKPIVPGYVGKDYTWDAEGLEELLDDIRKHPAYKPFDYGAPKEFLDFCSEDGWPNPKDVPQAYCELFGKALKRTVSALSEVTAEEWTELLAICKKKDSVPKILVDAVAAKQAPAVAPEDDDDPFADE